MNYKEDDIILCKITKVEGTSVFLETEEGYPGTMVLSEVAAGRIRNLRAYVAPNKKIVCKVLNVCSDHLELSLRRVTAKEREQVLEEYKKERALKNMLKIVGENPNEVIEKIKEKYDLLNFLEDARENPLAFENFVKKENAKKLFQILSEKEEREKSVEKKFTLRSLSDDGVNEIKEILNLKNCKIHYLGSAIFSISVSGKDFKEANNKLDDFLEEIKKRAKDKKTFIEIKEKWN